jgi:hypothetical protein
VPARTASPTITRPTVVVPNIVGLTTMDALHTLREAGLLFVVNRTMPVRDDDTVVEQLPEQGAEVPFLSVVVATADCHPQPCSGPAGQGLVDPCTCLYG